MENASKALIIASTVLLGVMIMSVGVALFNSFFDFSRLTIEKVENAKLAEWNNNFLKYYGTTSTYDTNTGKYITKKIKVTAHDIITVSNFAKQSNEKYELNQSNSGNENTNYVQVKVGNIENFENKTENEKNTFLKENSLTEANEVKYYVCEEAKISDITKRVMYIRFEEMKQ